MGNFFYTKVLIILLKRERLDAICTARDSGCLFYIDIIMDLTETIDWFIIAWLGIRLTLVLCKLYCVKCPSESVLFVFHQHIS